MKYLFKIYLILSALFISGCAAPYKPPTEKAPQNWYGKTGFLYEKKTLKIINREPKEGDIVLTSKVHLRRTAEITDGVVFRSAFGSEMLFSAGTAIWAEQYSVFKAKRNEPEYKNQQEENNPIEWCGFVNGGSIHIPESELYCMFWEAPNEARYVRGYGSKLGASHIPRSISSKGGTLGPVPNFIEKDIKLDETFTVKIFVDKINKIGVKFKEDISNGSYVVSSNYFYLKWADSNLVNRDGLKLSVFASDNYTALKIKSD
ncbi:MAG: hypothetical protein ACJA1U_000131 [Bermanella sp.]